MKKITHKTLTIGTIILLIAAFAYAFWPKPVMVDVGKVTVGKMQLTIDEEGYTRVNELYQVSAPVNGRMLRVQLKAGDQVQKNETIIARMLPNILSIKESQQAKADVQIALSTVDAAKATIKRVESEFILATHRAERAAKQVSVGAISVDENEQIQQAVASKASALAEAKSMLNVHLSELASAKAALLGNFQDNDLEQEVLEIIDIKAPISGKVLSILEKNETVLIAGAPIVTLGDVLEELEIVVEMLSSDALQVQPGYKVTVKNWKGSMTGQGVITTIEPRGFIKTSSLGVEERRVNVIVKPDTTHATPANLGHGFRVDTSIILWEKERTLIVPVSAMFREQGEWAVFVVEDGKTQLRQITVEHNNGTSANVIKGLTEGERVVLFPSADLKEGTSVVNRKMQ